MPLGIFYPRFRFSTSSLQTNQSSVGEWGGGFLRTCIYKPVQRVFIGTLAMQPSGLVWYDRVIEFVIESVNEGSIYFFFNAISYFWFCLNNFL